MEKIKEEYYFGKPNALNSVDCVIFGYNFKELKVLLIKKREEDPGPYKWGLPGGYLEDDLTLEETARKLLSRLTGIDQVFLQQFGTFSEVDRHPVARVITTAFYSLVSPDKYHLKPSWKAYDVKWWAIDNVPGLEFDHNKLLSRGLKKLRKDAKSKPIGLNLMPEKFTLPQLENMYEVILGTELEQRNFRKKPFKLDIIDKLPEKLHKMDGKAGRKPNLYKFNKSKYRVLERDGYFF